MNRLIYLFIAVLSHCSLFAIAQDKIFKEYDIRGVVINEFEVEDTYEIAAAISTYFLEKDAAVKTIAVGADGRVHSPLIKKQIIQALIDRGFNVMDIGTCTTPVLYFTMHTMPVDAGLMITASHNPGEYNGIKICLGKKNVYGHEIQEIRQHYANKTFIPVSKEQGIIQVVDMISRYIDCLAENFPHLVGMDLHAILDCGNGAAGTVLPALIEKMKWNHIELLYGEVDGTYPNHVADPTVEKYMSDLKAALAKSDAKLGIGFDGDVDRMAPMSKEGKLMRGDQLLVLHCQTLLKEYPGSAVVFDVSSSRSLIDLIKEMGGVPVISATGIVKVKKSMMDSEALIGGEMSCHTLFKDRYFGFDDGIYSMMRLFELLKKSEQNIDEWLASLPPTYTSPLFRIPCERSISLAIVERLKEIYRLRTDCELITVDGLRVHLPSGWAIVRASNTEPVISIRFEGNSPQELSQINQEFYKVIAHYIDCSELIR